MKLHILTLLMLLMAFNAFAQTDPAVDNYFLGWKFLNGRYDMPRDYDKAVKYFTLAADAGLSAGVCDLGYCYFNGLGVQKDQKKALELFQKAARMDEPDEFAQLYLYYFYGEGILVKKDKKMSNYWWSQCSEHFDEEDAVNYIVKLYHPELR